MTRTLIHRDELPGCILALAGIAVALLVLLVATSGCGASALSTAQDTTYRAGTALHEADAAVAPRIAAAAEHVGDSPEAGAAWLATGRATWAAVTDALEVARQMWLALDRALSAWSAGEDGSQAAWMRAAACSVGALAAATQALTAAGVDVPQGLRDVAESLSGLAGAICHSPEATP
jgi:hypothetical protein